MSRHIFDRAPRGMQPTPLLRYVRAGSADVPQSLERKLERLRRRAKGPHDPTLRMRRYLSIARGSVA